MTRRNVNPPPSVSTHKPPSMSLLGTDSEDEDSEMRMLPSRKAGRGPAAADPISLLERFEASGITSGGDSGGVKRRGRPQARDPNSEVSSPMHSAPATPLRQRTPRYMSGDSDEEGGA